MIRNGQRCCRPIVGGLRLCADEPGGEPGGGGGGDGGDPPAGLTIRLPPVNAEFSEEAMRDMGRIGSHNVGHYYVISGTHAVYTYHDGIGINPQAFDAALAGVTMIRVDLPAGNVDGDTVASLHAAAIEAELGDGTTSSGDEVNIPSATSIAGGGRSWATAGRAAGTTSSGILGMRRLEALAGFTFDVGSARAAQVDTSRWGGRRKIVTGFRWAHGPDARTSQAIGVLFQGGTPGNFEGATRLGVVAQTSGSAVNVWGYYGTTQGVLVDPANGVLWFAWSHPPGTTVEFSVPGSSNADTSDYVVTGGNCTHLLAGDPAPVWSSEADVPAVLPAVGSAETGVPAIALSYVDAEFQCDMRPVGRIGTRFGAGDSSLTFGSTSGDPLFVGNSFRAPDNLGMVASFREPPEVNYATHNLGSDYAVFLGIGGLADDDWSRAEFFRCGQTSGDATGWVPVAEAFDDIPIPANSRVWVNLKFDGVGGSELSFDAGTPTPDYGPPDEPAAYYLGNTTECEVDDGTLGGPGTETTNIDFDPADPSPATDPASEYTANGTIHRNNNNVGDRAYFAIAGFGPVIGGLPP